MSNQFESQKANPTVKEKLAQVAWGIPIEFRGAMLISWSILVLLSLISASRMSGVSPEVLVVSLLNAIVQSTLAVFAVFYMRGIEIQAGSPYLKSQMSWFGMLWRSYLSMLLSIIPGAAIVYLVLGPADHYTVPRIVIWGLIQGISLLFVVWAVFSKDRKGQIRWIFSQIRGW